MRVRFIQPHVHGGDSFAPNDELDLPERTAKRLINWGIAEKAAAAAPKAAAAGKKAKAADKGKK